MPSNQVAYGMTLRNFVAYPELPNPAGLIEQGEWIEQLGFESVWVWDHILLGVEPHFPIIDSLSLLTAIAARTRTVKLGTGVLILPLRNPVILAKQLSSMDVNCCWVSPRAGTSANSMPLALTFTSGARSWTKTSIFSSACGPKTR